MLVITDGISTEQNILFFPHFYYHLPIEYLRKITDGSVPSVIFALYVGANF